MQLKQQEQISLGPQTKTAYPNVSSSQQPSIINKTEILDQNAPEFQGLDLKPMQISCLSCCFLSLLQTEIITPSCFYGGGGFFIFFNIYIQICRNTYSRQCICMILQSFSYFYLSLSSACQQWQYSCFLDVSHCCANPFVCSVIL